MKEYKEITETQPTFCWHCGQVLIPKWNQRYNNHERNYCNETCRERHEQPRSPKRPKKHGITAF